MKVLVLFDTAGTPPDDQDFSAELKTEEWKTERHVIHALKNLGHEVFHAGIYDSISPLARAVETCKPDAVFNLVEHFRGDRSHDRDVVGYLELVGVPYTGTDPTGMLLCRDKGLCKTILSYHRIRNPKFEIFEAGRKVKKPAHLSFPLFVKPLSEDSSQGISRASFVEDDATLAERIKFIHESLVSSALAEEFIDGRELYVSILGNARLTAFPVREILFREVPDDEPKIATYKAKWDSEYRKRWGITNRFAAGIPDEILKNIEQVCKKVYRLLRIRGWGRIDLKLKPSGEIVILEANPNPFLASDEDFAESAKKADVSYDELIGKILTLGMERKTT